MSRVRVIALGSPMGSDDAAALRAAERLGDRDVEVTLAGRPGAGLVDLFDASVPTVILDVVRRGADPGAIVEVPLRRLAGAAVPGDGVSSHGLGLGDALRLAAALGRPIPEGVLLGIGGASFAPGETLSPEVERGLDAFVQAARDAIGRLRDGEGGDGCTSTG